MDFLQRWYAEQCNGDWEHEFGIKIETLDNPGWNLEIDLSGTGFEGQVLSKSKLVPPAGGWVWLWSDGQKYYSSCDELSLGLAIEQFRSFVELPTPVGEQ